MLPMKNTTSPADSGGTNARNRRHTSETAISAKPAKIVMPHTSGIPPTFKIYGHGELIPPGPAGALGNQSLGDPSLNPIITQARQWSPAAMVQYHFRSPGVTFRPFVGLGTLAMLVNVILLTLYTITCHSFRYLMGGRLDHFSRVRGGVVWHRITVVLVRLKPMHGAGAWYSMFSVT